MWFESLFKLLSSFTLNLLFRKVLCFFKESKEHIELLLSFITSLKSEIPTKKTKKKFSDWIRVEHSIDQWFYIRFTKKKVKIKNKIFIVLFFISIYILH